MKRCETREWDGSDTVSLEGAVVYQANLAHGLEEHEQSGATFPSKAYAAQLKGATELQLCHVVHHGQWNDMSQLVPSSQPA